MIVGKNKIWKNENYILYPQNEKNYFQIKSEFFVDKPISEC